MKYLPGLNAIRFYAALSVLVHHIAGYAGDWFNQPRPYTVLHNFILNPAYAVTLFFVLSGYLITTLLLNERRTTGNIAITAFYGRRVLRIWPLYYAVIALAALVAAFGGMPLLFDNPAVSAAYILLAANLLVFAAPLGNTLLGHLWTIGVEEQFYIAWPHVVKRIRHPVRFLLAFIAFKLSLVFVAYILIYYDPRPVWGGLLLFLEGTRFECMAVGALAAYLVDRRSLLLRLLYSRVGQVVTIALLVIVGFVIPPATPFHHVAASFLFAALMVNVSTNPHPLFSLEHPLIRAGGDISYGIYMLHPLVIYATVLLLKRLGLGDSAFLLNVIAITGTVGAAVLSYRFYERPFLRLKARYTVVPSQAH